MNRDDITWIIFLSLALIGLFGTIYILQHFIVKYW